MLSFKTTNGIYVLPPGETGDGIEMCVFVYPVTKADDLQRGVYEPTDAHNIQYMMRMLGFEKSLYESNLAVNAKKTGAGSTYLSNRVDEVKKKFMYMAQFGLSLMMQLMYLNEYKRGETGEKGANKALKATYITVEDAFAEVRQATARLKETFEFITELHYPLKTTASILESESKDFDLQAERAFGISSKSRNKK
jgi:hypothetical protein